MNIYRRVKKYGMLGELSVYYHLRIEWQGKKEEEDEEINKNWVRKTLYVRKRSLDFIGQILKRL